MKIYSIQYSTNFSAQSKFDSIVRGFTVILLRSGTAVHHNKTAVKLAVLDWKILSRKMALNSHFDRVTESNPPCPRILNHIPECEESTSPPPAKKPRQLELGNYFNKVISELPIYLKTPPGVESEYSMKRVVGADSTTAHRLVLVGK